MVRLSRRSVQPAGAFMSDTRDPQAVIAAAEQAANAGDFPAAERLLLEAANLQEASLGPAHPDLANTYNNLGVVYEITGKPAGCRAQFSARLQDRDRCISRSSSIRRDQPEEPRGLLRRARYRRRSASAGAGTRHRSLAEPAPPPAPAAAETTPTPAPPPGGDAAAEGSGARCEASAGSAGSAMFVRLSPRLPPSRPRPPIDDTRR